MSQKLQPTFSIGIWLLSISLLIGAAVEGQNPSLKIAISNNYLQPGDSLEVSAQYTLGDRQLPPATLVVAIEGPKGKLWQLRRPMLDGKADGIIIFPDSLPTGKYNLLFAVQPRFFKLYGEVIYPTSLKKLEAIFSNEGGIHPMEIELKGGKFELDQVYLEGESAVLFNHDNNRQKGPPLVKLEAWLDSTFSPAAINAVQIVLNSKDSLIYNPIGLRKDQVLDSLGNDVLYANFEMRRKAMALSNLSAIQMYDSLYVPIGFKALPAATINCMADSLQLTYSNVFDLLKKRNTDMKVGIWADEESINITRGLVTREQKDVAGETMVKMGRKWYRIYHKGAYGDPTALTFPPEAFTMIKIFEPDFSTIAGTNWSFGVIAFFDRQFPLPNPFPYYHKFNLKGYSPEVFTIPLH